MEKSEGGVEFYRNYAQKLCEQEFDWAVDYASYDDDWSTDWTPMVFTGYCAQAFDGIARACRGGESRLVGQIKQVKCYYKEDLVSGGKSGGMYIADVQVVGSELRVGVRQSMGSLKTPVARALETGTSKRK